MRTLGDAGQMVKFRECRTYGRAVVAYICVFLYGLAAFAGEIYQAPSVPQLIPAEQMTSSGSSRNQDSECADLQVGQSRTVNRDRIGNDINASQKFRVTMASGNQLNIDLNIGFIGTTDAKAELGNPNQSDDQISQTFAKKANDCFQNYKSKLQDRDGMSVNVNVISDQSNHDVPINAVTVESNSLSRANSENWTSASTCATIIHESFHLMGLVDGYSEKSFKNARGETRFDCRKPERQNTIMSDPELAIAGPKVDTLLCVCVAQSCGKAAYSSQSTNSEPKCPTGYQESGGDGMGSVEMTPDEVLAKEAGMQKGKSGLGMIFVKKVTAKKDDPALSRRHIQFIEKPDCQKAGETSATYRQCAENAYRTKSDEGCDTSVPPACADIRWMD